MHHLQPHALAWRRAVKVVVKRSWCKRFLPPRSAPRRARWQKGAGAVAAVRAWRALVVHQISGNSWVDAGSGGAQGSRP